jgi:hypothetical protein
VAVLAWSERRWLPKGNVIVDRGKSYIGRYGIGVGGGGGGGGAGSTERRQHRDAAAELR